MLSIIVIIELIIYTLTFIYIMKIFWSVIIQISEKSAGSVSAPRCEKDVTLHKVSLHLSLIWLLSRTSLIFFFLTICPYLECQRCSSPFFQYLLTIVLFHHSHRLPVHLKMHLQQLVASLNNCKLYFFRKMGKEEKRKVSLIEFAFAKHKSEKF